MIKYATFIEEKPVVRTMIDEYGREVLDKTPVSIPIQSAPAPSSLLQLMHQLYMSMSDQGVETLEEANDFDIPDEIGIEMMDTPYEQDFDHIENVPEPASQPAPVSPESTKSQEVTS